MRKKPSPRPSPWSPALQPAVAADWDALAHAGGQSANWLVYGGNLANTRYVANDEINAANVADLEPGGSSRPASSARSRTRRSSRTA